MEASGRKAGVFEAANIGNGEATTWSDARVTRAVSWRPFYR